jgi:hypothetical protein
MADGGALLSAPRDMTTSSHDGEKVSIWWVAMGFTLRRQIDVGSFSKTARTLQIGSRCDPWLQMSSTVIALSTGV